MSHAPDNHRDADRSDDLVPDNVISAGALPPMRYRDMPRPIPLRKMIGPSIILAGLALGSGEFVLWPYLTYHSGFVFFWACILGVATQYFLNMEVTRWTLATGESATTGFIRLGKYWAWIFLLLNIIPWMIPAWAKGAAQILSWMIWGPEFVNGDIVAPYDVPLAIGGMVLCGVVLTAGPVLYETVERIQLVLVSLVILLITLLAAWMLYHRPDAIVAQATAVFTLGSPDFVPDFDQFVGPMMLLGALAFAGAGGTTNLGQADYIKDKGYGMGAHIGRITSPLTGKEEPITEVGCHFPATEENLSRWRGWWRAASWEHFLSFFLTCLYCLVLLSLISYAIFYDEAGNRLPDTAQYEDNMGFIWGEAQAIGRLIGPAAMTLFLVAGIAILLTTEFGVLDVVTRISTDIVKTRWLRDHTVLTESRLYYFFLWGAITLGSAILLLKNVGVDVEALVLFKFTSALNGMVMFLYSCTLLYLNLFRLPKYVRMSRWRAAIMIWSILFFGFFSVWALWTTAHGLLGGS